MQSCLNLRCCFLGTSIEIMRKFTENLGSETAEYGVDVLIIRSDG